MRLPAFIGLLALSVLIGSLALAHLGVPQLAETSPLLDPNLAKATAHPLELRLSELGLGAAAVLAIAAPRFVGSRVGTTVALLLLAGTAADRVALLPALHEAWGAVDLVSERPAQRFVDAQQLQTARDWLVFTLAGLSITVAWIASGTYAMSRVFKGSAQSR